MSWCLNATRHQDEHHITINSITIVPFINDEGHGHDDGDGDSIDDGDYLMAPICALASFSLARSMPISPSHVCTRSLSLLNSISKSPA